MEYYNIMWVMKDRKMGKIMASLIIIIIIIRIKLGVIVIVIVMVIVIVIVIVMVVVMQIRVDRHHSHMCTVSSSPLYQHT